MHCLFCKHIDTEVIETRPSEDGRTIRRRRICTICKKRFTTYERVEELPMLVIKRDGRRERFNRDKLRSGLLKSAEKTTVSAEQVQTIVSDIENDIMQREASEIESQRIGSMIAERLRMLDKVAYIRFASVFRRFVDVEEFERELKRLL